MFFVSMRNIGIENFSLSLSFIRCLFGHNSLPEKVSSAKQKRRIFFPFSLLMFSPRLFLWNAISPGRTGPGHTQVYAQTRESSGDVCTGIVLPFAFVFFFSRHDYTTLFNSITFDRWFFRGVCYLCNSLGGCVKTQWITISRKTRLSFLFFKFSQL